MHCLCLLVPPSRKLNKKSTIATLYRWRGRHCSCFQNYIPDRIRSHHGRNTSSSGEGGMDDVPLARSRRRRRRRRHLGASELPGVSYSATRGHRTAAAAPNNIGSINLGENELQCTCMYSVSVSSWYRLSTALS